MFYNLWHNGNDGPMICWQSLSNVYFSCSGHVASSWCAPKWTTLDSFGAFSSSADSACPGKRPFWVEAEVIELGISILDPPDLQRHRWLSTNQTEIRKTGPSSVAPRQFWSCGLLPWTAMESNENIKKHNTTHITPL